MKGNLNNINNSDEEVSKKNDEGIQKTKVNRVPTKPRIRIRPDVEIQKSFEENFQIQKHGLDQLVFKPYEKKLEFISRFENHLEEISLEEKNYFGKVCWGAFEDYWYNIKYY